MGMASNNNKEFNKKTGRRGGTKYEEYIKNEIRKETFSDNCDVDRIMFLLDELKKIHPPKDVDIDESFRKFCEKNNIFVTSDNRHMKRKKIVLVAAAITIVIASGVIAIGDKFNVFDMWFASYENKVDYFQNTNEDFNASDELNEVSKAVTVNTIEEAQRLIPFTLLVPYNLPEGYSIDDIQVDNISEDFVEVCINYSNDEKSIISIYATYTGSEDGATNSQQYEGDYGTSEMIKIMGQDCLITSDTYNSNCTFKFDKTVYAITASKNISMSEFKNMLESIDFWKGV